MTALLPDATGGFSLPAGLAGEYTRLKGGSPETALVHVEAVVNPLTTGAQSIASILCVLQDGLGEAIVMTIAMMIAAFIPSSRCFTVGVLTWTS